MNNPIVVEWQDKDTRGFRTFYCRAIVPALTTGMLELIADGTAPSIYIYAHELVKIYAH